MDDDESVPVGVCPVNTLPRTDRIIGMTEVICMGSEMESSLGAGPSRVSWNLALVLSLSVASSSGTKEGVNLIIFFASLQLFDSKRNK
jgi:hypothetical protein